MGDILKQLMQRQLSPDEVYQRNSPYVAEGAGNFNTELNPLQELLFRSWIDKNKVPFNPDSSKSDYDMRGFFSAMQSGDPRANASMNQNDSQMHYPDYWKTPYHETFSSESRWAKPVAPKWNEQDQLIAPSGRILFDERNR